MFWGRKRGKYVYIPMLQTKHIISTFFFQVFRLLYYNPDLPPPPTILGLYIVSFQILRVIYSLFKKKKKKKKISAISQPITIKFYQKHYWGGGQVALGFVVGRKRTLVSMATDSSHRLTMGKHKKHLLKNHKAGSFQSLYVAMYSGSLYKSCQPCPWGRKWPRPRGSLSLNDLTIFLLKMGNT